MTTAGDLRFRVRFEKKGQVRGDGGIVRTGWVPQFTCWADVKSLRGGEGVQEQRLAGVQPAVIIVRASSQTRQITPAWRAVQLQRGAIEVAYGLKSVADMDGDGAYLTVLGTAGDADGR